MHNELPFGLFQNFSALEASSKQTQQDYTTKMLTCYNSRVGTHAVPNGSTHCIVSSWRQWLIYVLTKSNFKSFNLPFMKTSLATYAYTQTTS